jgi:hypothetical protein
MLVHLPSLHVVIDFLAFLALTALVQLTIARLAHVALVTRFHGVQLLEVACNTTDKVLPCGYGATPQATAGAILPLYFNGLASRLS